MSEKSRRDQRTPILLMVVFGAIASGIGIAIGLAIHWFPVQASTQAPKIDNLYDVLIIVTVPIFVLVSVIVLFSAWKFKVRPGEELLDGPPIHGNTKLEVVWTAIPAIMLVAMCSYAYARLTNIEQAQANEMTINVTGQQFAWTYEYPQADGKSVKSDILYLPNNRPVRFSVHALDVIHDFWVPAFRMKIDAVPGITTHYRVTPDRLGTYAVVCAELCGLGHSVMRSTAKVVPPATFNAWIAKQKNPGAASAPGATTSTTGAGAPTSGAAAPATVDAKALFSSAGCSGCHTLADAGANGAVGPNLDKTLKGKSADFIRTSIVKPNAQIAPGFQAGIMPQTFGSTLKPAEIDALVTYLGKVAGK
jgi:cytochrome c oxidase subunit 2